MSSIPATHSLPIRMALELVGSRAAENFSSLDSALGRGICVWPCDVKRVWEQKMSYFFPSCNSTDHLEFIFLKPSCSNSQGTSSASIPQTLSIEKKQ